MPPENRTASPTRQEMPAQGSFKAYMSYVEDELHGADRYHVAGEDDIAREEMRHANHFLDAAKMVAYTKEEQTEWKNAKARFGVMAQVIGY